MGREELPGLEATGGSLDWAVDTSHMELGLLHHPDSGGSCDTGHMTLRAVQSYQPTHPLTHPPTSNSSYT